MKKLIFGLFTFSMFGANAQNSDLTIENGTIKFSTINIYESYADNPANLKSLQELGFPSSEVTTSMLCKNISKFPIIE
jgi:hypothetical protein